MTAGKQKAFFCINAVGVRRGFKIFCPDFPDFSKCCPDFSRDIPDYIDSLAASAL